jgi:hypothetical protein
MRKALLAAVCVSALGLGTSALAQEAGNITNSGLNSSVTGFNQTDDSTNVDLTVDDSLNNNSDNSQNTTVEIDDTGNDNSDNSQNLTVDLNDSFNDNSVTRTSVNFQDLDGTVSGSFIVFNASGAGAVQNGDFVTGNSDVDTSGSFAGVQNTGHNTGFAANALIANGISANANISFGEGTGPSRTQPNTPRKCGSM